MAKKETKKMEADAVMEDEKEKAAVEQMEEKPETDNQELVPVTEEQEAHTGDPDVEEQGDHSREPAAEGMAEKTDVPVFYITTTVDEVLIRSDPSHRTDNQNVIGCIREKTGEKKKHGIVRQESGYGKLADEPGWIELFFTARVLK